MAESESGADKSEEPTSKRLEEARQLARDNPVAVASILKTWVNGD